MQYHKRLLIASLSIAVLFPLCARADVRLPDVLGDHMVLQENSDAMLWGWAYAGETVLIETSWGIKTQVVADAKGEWRVKLKTPAAQPLDKGLHPENITFTVPGENAVQLKDVLIGEVWVCSGQSNMAMILGPDYPQGNNNWFGEAFWKEESKNAERPGLRLFNVEKTAAATPQVDCKGVIPDHIRLPKDKDGLTPYVKRDWQICTFETATYFSAVGYYFGATLQEKLNVPVGLVTCPVGGTPIESWISLDALHTLPDYSKATTEVHRNGNAALFNGMIAPLTPMKIKGVLWYQGESNMGMGSRYGILFQVLINDWRRRFDNAELPFYFVQLAPFGNGRSGQAAALREAQASALQLKNTGMAVTNDVGEPGNIHPKNKRDIGRRLAWQALNKTYGYKEIAADGPAFQALTFKDGKLNITFQDLGGGLISRDAKPLNCFEIAGPDHKFVPATAIIEGDEVAVSSPVVSQPKTARFAWGDGDVPNLMSKNGLPAAQFSAELK